MVAPVIPAALIISTDRPAVLPVFIFEMAFFTIWIVIRIGGASTGAKIGRSLACLWQKFLYKFLSSTV